MRLALFFLPVLACAQPQLVIDAGSPADLYFTGGAAWGPGTPGYDPAQGTGVYATLRYGTNFAYDIPETEGLYHIVLDFVEPNKTAPGQRKFACTLNGFSTGTLDLFALIGLHVPLQKSFLVLAGDGHIRVQCTATVGNAVLSGIEIFPAAFAYPPVKPPEVAVWFMCEPTAPPPPNGAPDCSGLQYFVIKRPDGSDGGQWFGVPAQAAPSGAQWKEVK